MYKMIVNTEKAINKHYDEIHKLDHLSMDPAGRYLSVEVERDKALQILQRDGQVTFKVTGQKWEVVA